MACDRLKGLFSCFQGFIGTVVLFFEFPLNQNTITFYKLNPINTIEPSSLAKCPIRILDLSIRIGHLASEDAIELKRSPLSM